MRMRTLTIMTRKSCTIPCT